MKRLFGFILVILLASTALTTATTLLDATRPKNTDLVSTLDDWLRQTRAAINTLIVGAITDIVYVYPEEYGAVGDNATDDLAAIQAAIDACPTSGVVRFTSAAGYYFDATTIGLVMPSDKYITLEGGGTLLTCKVDGDDDKCISLIDSMSTTSLKNRIIGINLVSAASPFDYKGTGIHWEDTTLNEIDYVRISGFNKDLAIVNNVTGNYCETNRIIHSKFQDANYCVYMAKRCSAVGFDGEGIADATCSYASTSSMATNVFEQVQINPKHAGGYGFYQGRGISLYRSQLNLTIFPGMSNTTAAYFDGTGLITGQINVEGQVSKTGYTGNRGIVIGPNAKKGLILDMPSSAFGTAGPVFDKDVAAPATPGIRVPGGSYGMTNIIWDGELTNIWSAKDAGNLTTAYIKTITAIDADTIQVDITNATETLDTVHGLSNGDDVFFYLVSGSDGTKNPDWAFLEDTDAYTVTVVDTDSFTVDIDSDTYGDATTFTVYEQITSIDKLRFGRYRWRNAVNASGYPKTTVYGKLIVEDMETGSDYANVQLTPILNIGSISDNSATISAKHTGIIRLTNSIATTITEITDGTAGQILILEFGNNNTSIQDTTISGVGNLQLKDDQTIQGIIGASVTLFYLGATSTWIETGYSSPQNLVNTWANKPTRPRVGDIYTCTNCGTPNATITWDGTVWRYVGSGTEADTTTYDTGDMLLSVTTVPLNANNAGLTLYTVPTGKRCVLTKAILVANGDAGATTTMTIGKSTALTDFLGTQTLSNLDAQYDVVTMMPVPNATPVKHKSYAAADIIQAVIANQSGNSGSATSKLYLFGFLY